MLNIFLRSKSQYSFLNSTLEVDDLITEASKLKIKYLALTDVENLFACFKFYQMAENAGIRPIIGTESKLLNNKFLLIAENYEGLINISKWLSLKDKKIDDLADFADNVILILLPPCTEEFTIEDVSAEITAHALFGIFGKNFYIGIDETKNNKFYRIAPNKIVFTPNIAFLYDTDYKDLKLINTEVEKGITFKTALSIPPYTECIKNMQEIAEKCSINFKQNTKDIKTERIFLEKLSKIADQALRISNYHSQNIYIDRLKEELRLIAEKNFASFICSVIELVNYARMESIPISPGRGSAVSLLLLYLTNVTMVDPIKFNLKLERFFSSDDIFDIDIEVASNRKEQLVNFLQKKYSKIIRLPIVRKANTREVILKFLPSEEKNNIELYEKNIDLIKKGGANIKLPKDVDVSLISKILRFSNLKKGYTVHPSAIVYNDNDSLLTFQADNQIISWFSKDDLKRIKINKLDLLSSIVLDKIQEKLELLSRKSTQAVITDYTKFTRKLEYNNQEVYKFLEDGNFKDVFQFNDKWKWLLKERKPRNLEQLAECIALQRPGIIDVKIYCQKLDSDVLKKILYKIAKETNNKIIYQEQFTALLSNLLDIPYFDAEKQRKQLKKGVIVDQYLDIISKKIGCNKQDLEVIKEIITSMGQYAYNKAHAMAYAMVVYQTAFLEMELNKIELRNKTIDIENATTQQLKVDNKEYREGLTQNTQEK